MSNPLIHDESQLNPTTWKDPVECMLHWQIIKGKGKSKERIRLNKNTLLHNVTSVKARCALSLHSVRVSLAAGPACKHKSDLVEHICNIVEHIEEGLIHSSEQITEQIARRVDGPARCDDQAHVLEGSHDCLAAPLGSAAGFAKKDLVQNEEPATQATKPCRPCREGTDLAAISKREHDDGAEEEFPEHLRAGLFASSFEDQVELNHLQRDGDAPVHVSVDDRGGVNLHPILTHVKVVHTCNQSDQTTHVQGCLPLPPM